MRIDYIYKAGTLAAGLLLAGNTYAGTCEVEFANTFPDFIDSTGQINFFLGGQSGDRESYLFDLASNALVNIRHFGAPTDSVGTSWLDQDGDGNYETLVREVDDANGSTQFAFSESLATGFYCIETSAFADAEPMPWSGTVEIDVTISNNNPNKGSPRQSRGYLM